jgi:hypothetical protein
MYECLKCHKDFKNKTDFSRHKKRKTPCKPNNNKKLFKCDSCDKMYSSRQSKHKHMKQYCKSTISSQFTPEFTPEVTPQFTRQFMQFSTIIKCKICEKEFSRNDSLKRHLYKSCRKPPNHDNGDNNSHTSDNNSEYSDNKYDGDGTIENINKININRIEPNLDSYLGSGESKEEIYITLLQKMMTEKDMERQNNVDKEKKYNELMEQMNDMRHELEMMRKQKSHQTINNINNINNIHNIKHISNTYEIQLVAFGNEDKSHLTYKDIYHLLKKGFNSVPELIKAIHFNENKPENHNVYIPSMSRNYVMVYDGEDWGLKDKVDTIEDIFDDGRNFLIIKKDEISELLNGKYENEFKKFDRFNSQIDNTFAKEKKESILNDIKLILYNKKELPLTTKKKIYHEII